MKLIILLLFPLQLFAQSTSILFKNVNIIDVKKGSVIANQNVLIEGNKIKSISSKTLPAKNAIIINATGKYLIPGLCDFNAYVLQYENEGIPAFQLLLANGVTSVRDLALPGRLEDAYAIKQKITNKKILAPRLYLSGKTLIDRLPYQKENESKSLLVTSILHAEKAVDSMINLGADVIDTRNILNESILRVITNRAHQKGKKVMAWHSGNWITGSNNGLDAYTHLSALWRVTSKGREKFFAFNAGDSSRFVSAAEFYNRLLPSLGSVDTPYFYSVMKTLKRNNTWLCTGTTSYFQSLRTFEYGDSSRNVYRNARQKQAMDENTKIQSTIIVKGEKPDMSDLYMAHKTGVFIIAGTQMSGLITPGMSLHDMLYWLVDGGFTPAEALRTATINPAIFLNKQTEIGTVEKGKLADLVLLDANPLEDISNTRKINAVVTNGKLLQRSDLDKLLEEGKAKVRK